MGDEYTGNIILVNKYQTILMIYKISELMTKHDNK